jgi:hypothetical protein
MKIFIGYDSREDIAYQVCRHSLLKHTSIPLDIKPIKQYEMRERGIYWREQDPLSSTEFTFTRFLVPYLAGYKGWAVFMDCDFYWRGDVAGLQDYMNPSCGVCVVPHNYTPKETHKMDGKVQHQYPRKNWSSLMLINCGHKNTVEGLTLQDVNKRSGMYLHQLQWADKHVGHLPIAYNYLEGWHTRDDCPNPVAVHFTRGGPWFHGFKDVEYGQEWLAVSKEIIYE